MASMTENTPMKTPTNHNKRRPGTKNEVQTPILIRNSERQCKTRVINALKAQASRIRRLKTEPCEVLFVIRELKTDKYKFMGYGDVLNRFIEGKPITSCVNYKRQKYTIPRIQDLPNKVQTLTPEKYAFSFTPRSVSLKQQQKTSLSSPQFRTEENETSTSERVKRKPATRGKVRGKSNSFQRRNKLRNSEKCSSHNDRSKEEATATATTLTESSLTESTLTESLLDEDDNDNPNPTLEELFYYQENVRSAERSDEREPMAMNEEAPQFPVNVLENKEPQENMNEEISEIAVENKAVQQSIEDGSREEPDYAVKAKKSKRGCRRLMKFKETNQKSITDFYNKMSCT